MADQSTCLSPVCGVTVEGNHKKCPTCGWTMRSARNIRFRGAFLVVCGLILLGLMGTITLNLWETLRYPERAIASGDFTGTREQAETFLNLFLMVLGFGALALVNGLYMLVSGRTNKWFVIATLLAGGILFLMAYSISEGIKPS